MGAGTASLELSSQLVTEKPNWRGLVVLFAHADCFAEPQTQFATFPFCMASMGCSEPLTKPSHSPSPGAIVLISTWCDAKGCPAAAASSLCSWLVIAADEEASGRCCGGVDVVQHWK